MNSVTNDALQSNPDTRHMFDETAREYDPNVWFDHSARSPYAYESTRTRLLKLLALNGSEDILEVGCGPGTWTREMAPLCHNIHAVDISTNMIERAKHFAAAPNASFHVEDFATYASDARYDRVVSLRAVEYMREGTEAVAKLGSFVAPGGRLVVVTKTRTSIWRGRRFVASKLRRRWRADMPSIDSGPTEPFYHHRLSARDLGKALSARGLVDISVHPVVTGIPVLAGVEGDVPLVPARYTDRALEAANGWADWIDARPNIVSSSMLWITESYAIVADRPAS